MKKQKDLALKNENEELKNQLARALADYDNLRKRVERERGELVQSSSARIVSNLLPIIDMLLNAQNHLQDSGLAIVVQELKEVLKQEGYIEIVTNQGDEFDANLHEAIDTIDGEDEGKIAEILENGWKRTDGFIVRPTKVKVYKKLIN